MCTQSKDISTANFSAPMTSAIHHLLWLTAICIFITLLWAGPTIDARIIFAAVDTVNEIIYLFIKIPAVVWLMSIPPPIFWRNVPVS
jgi:multisubunit Na+/H+ antiporter MnhF subunit